MNWIDKLFPVVTLIIGWGISEYGKYSLERKNNGKKFKKLLFNLLELRWLLKKETDLNKDITTYIERLKEKLLKEFGAEAIEGIDMVKPIIIELLKNNIVEPNKIKNIEENIDLTINELSEIYPVFAYELSDKYKIKERLEAADKYFKEASELLENMPDELTNWVQPQLSQDLFLELDENIISIANNINRKTKKAIEKKLSYSNNNNFEEVDDFINQYIEKIKTMANNI